MAATEHQRSVTVTLVGMTDVGRVRQHNEGAFLVLDRAAGRRAANGEQLQVELRSATVFAVADGMGGAAAGEVASRMASDTLAEILGAADYADATPDQIAALMDHAIQQANDEILKEAADNPERKGMGTTMTAAVGIPGRLFISQVGDSRGYLLRKGKINRLTKDQSLIEQLIEEGTLTEEEAEKLGGRNIVLQAVGVEESLRVDTKHWEVLRGDVVLLCSDGLTGMVKDEAVESILNECAGDLPAALERLIDAANDGGGRDNITAVLARFDGEGLRAPMEALAGGVERAGAGFAAPPPPDEPNPMKRVGGVIVALLVVIAGLFVALRRTTTDLTVAWAPAELAVTVRLLDAAGNELRRTDAAGGSAELRGLEPGDYRVAVSAPAHFDDQKDVSFEVGDAEVTLELVPRPGAVTIRVGTPHVRVDVLAEGSGRSVEAFDESKASWPDPAEPIRYERVPAGPVRVRVSRAPGFEPLEETQTLPPEGAVEFAFPALAEVRGVLVVRTPGPGFRVVVVNGQELLADALTGADGSARLDVRVGRHEVRVTREGWDEKVLEAEVAPGAPAEIEAEASVRAVAVTIAGTPGAIFRVERHTPDGWEPDGPQRKISATGVYARPVDLAPGRYRITWQGGEREFEIEAGSPGMELRLE